MYHRVTLTLYYISCNISILLRKVIQIIINFGAIVVYYAQKYPERELFVRLMSMHTLCIKLICMQKYVCKKIVPHISFDKSALKAQNITAERNRPLRFAVRCGGRSLCIRRHKGCLMHTFFIMKGRKIC